LLFTRVDFGVEIPDVSGGAIVYHLAGRGSGAMGPDPR
jgi:hypothetical protein